MRIVSFDSGIIYSTVKVIHEEDFELKLYHDEAANEYGHSILSLISMTERSLFHLGTYAEKISRDLVLLKFKNVEIKYHITIEGINVVRVTPLIKNKNGDIKKLTWCRFESSIINPNLKDEKILIKLIAEYWGTKFGHL